MANNSPLSGLSLKDRQFVLEGYRDDCRTLSLDTKSAERMRRLRFAIYRLELAKGALDEFLRLPEKTGLSLKEACISGAITFYFSVFKQGPISPMLDPNEVFKDNSEALARHKDWLRIRDTKLVHPGELMTSLASALIVNSADEFVDFVTIKMDSPISSEHQWLQLLYQLINEALAFVDNAVEKTFQRIKREVGEMSRSQIQDIEPATVKKPNMP